MLEFVKKSSQNSSKFDYYFSKPSGGSVSTINSTTNSQKGQPNPSLILKLNGSHINGNGQSLEHDKESTVSLNGASRGSTLNGQNSHVVNAKGGIKKPKESIALKHVNQEESKTHEPKKPNVVSKDKNPFSKAYQTADQMKKYYN